MTHSATTDLDALRGQVRAAQHVRSFPLLVVGGLLVNYGVVNFAAQPVAWRYGAPLAFVLLWALGKLNETRVGIGPARADYLVAAGFVFTATNLVFLNIFLRNLNFAEVTGIWVFVVGIAMLGIARATRDGLIAIAGLLVMAAGIVAAFAARFTDAEFAIGSGGVLVQSWPNELISVVGAVFAAVGLLLYRRERLEA
jgi:hypothetical protein